ncbi:hypothetical protein CFB3_23780 [Clostridium folliculivorans]|uniref:Uncharacterized protein n=1 Tax=Clostridium folliculivorans TaxID=2886038 RepID=A0A9W6D9Q9_9CLOT|nr:hypothetical protein CFOLD11_09920 [Clostridium folliculivorans]GKU30271.1 hypothetical protein CFB3_23780 [Clostridium folliculivorans]
MRKAPFPKEKTIPNTMNNTIIPISPAGIIIPPLLESLYTLNFYVYIHSRNIWIVGYGDYQYINIL